MYNHTGIVVTDLDRSKRFYQDVLGFQFWYEITPDDEMTAKLSSLQPPLGMTASYYVLEGFVLEFLHYSGARQDEVVHDPDDGRARAHPPLGLGRRHPGDGAEGRRVRR